MGNIYQGNPCTIAALKNAITEKIQTIIQEESASVINKFSRRVQHCQVNAEHLIMYFRAPLDILGSYLKLNGFRS